MLPAINTGSLAFDGRFNLNARGMISLLGLPIAWYTVTMPTSLFTPVSGHRHGGSRKETAGDGPRDNLTRVPNHLVCSYLPPLPGNAYRMLVQTFTTSPASIPRYGGHRLATKYYTQVPGQGGTNTDMYSGVIIIHTFVYTRSSCSWEGGRKRS